MLTVADVNAFPTCLVATRESTLVSFSVEVNSYLSDRNIMPWEVLFFFFWCVVFYV
jgi:hypothetical protein